VGFGRGFKPFLRLNPEIFSSVNALDTMPANSKLILFPHLDLNLPC